MTSYKAPLTEINFVLNALINLEKVTSLPGYEEVTPDLVSSILEEASKLGEEVLAPLNRIGDIQGCKLENGIVNTPKGFKEAYQKFIAGGWNSLPFDPEYGGQGLPWLVSTAVSEIWHSANMAFTLCPMLNYGATELLYTHGSERLKSKYLPSMVSGIWTGCMNLTEPQAGSDLGSIRCKAIEDGDAYRILGTKIYITFGEHNFTENIIHMVLARKDDAPEGVKGISLFLVPKFLVNDDKSLGARNDLRCVSIEHKLGINASPTAVMSFGDNDGAVGYLVGEENRGLEYMFTMMNNERLAVGLEGVGIGERAYQQALSYAHERVQGRKVDNNTPEPVPIIEHPDVKRMLLSMKVQIEATRALAYFVAAELDIANRHPNASHRKIAQSRVDLLTPVIKAWGSDSGIEVANIGIQVHGGMGFIEETGAAQHFRDARIASIYEGTNGIQANDLVGRKVGRENAETVLALTEEMRTVSTKLASSDTDHIKSTAELFIAALLALEKASKWIAGEWSSDRFAVAAGAVPYLRLLGLTTGAWLLSRSALTAQELLNKEEGNADFLNAKIVSARFFSDQYLVQCPALYHTIRNGSSAIKTLPSRGFTQYT